MSIDESGVSHDHGHQDCVVVIEQVWALLDGEVTDETRDELRVHLERCPACLRQYGVEERIKRLIATKCSGEKAPEGLVQRVRMEISRTTIIRGEL
ncbi:mycothiol system anti-sigma-R factor [Mycolicibacterium sp.]|uniref:mycothiol system anti-sigma-R factor n=1 Tax=Mycolicibacterium sp. TaxID=2320850 RepID=UPI001D896701|nr:mycothiol system anti-sigma-R factor [Mycolicibacterium sp.]MCB1291814.1 mycothiol system anti-sigma-R factor [Mycobacterium sp.]MCB9409646.1 mycothiol system anti-sigma-R factor [Mycolicibacterium sp.]